MRILSRLERLEDEILPPPPAEPWFIQINFVDSRRGECYGFDPEKGDPNFKAPEPMVIQVDQHREPGWRTARRYPRARGHW